MVTIKYNDTEGWHDARIEPRGPIQMDPAAAILLHPETVVVLNGSGADILELCDGRHTVAEIVAELGARYQAVPDDEVQRFLTRLIARRCVELANG